MHCHSLFFFPRRCDCLHIKWFFCFFIYPLGSFQAASINICLIPFVLYDFFQYIIHVFLHIFLRLHFKIISSMTEKTLLSSLGVSYRQSGWLIFSVSLHNIMNMKITAIKRSEFSHFNARLWHRLCLVVLAVKGSNRLGYSINERPLVSVPNC